MKTKIAFMVLLFALLVIGMSQAQDSAGITHGPMSGEVSESSVVLWARAGEAGTLNFELSLDEDFADILQESSVGVDESTDFTGQVRVDGLDAAQSYYYRVSLDGGEAKTGAFKTAPEDASAFNFVFGSCLGGQGYCRPPETGWTIFQTMAAQNPDFFLLTGDSIYSGSACPTEDNRNVAGAETPASDLDGYYGRYRYHLEDEHYAAFLAQTPNFVTWDDHEIMDNFGGPELKRLNPARYLEGRKAFFDYWVLEGAGTEADTIYRQFSYGDHADFFLLDTRSYRDPIVNWDPSPVTGVHKTMLGADQYQWLTEGLRESESTWKFIVSSVPLSYPTGFPQPQVDGRDGWANGGNASGYENELMSLLFFIEAHQIPNVVFISGDTHWPFAISYDPDKDGVANFYELSVSPLSAITLPPGTIDQTFNPSVLYAEGEFQGDLFVFGHVSVADDGELTFRVVHRDGEEKFSLSLSPQ